VAERAQLGTSWTSVIVGAKGCFADPAGVASLLGKASLQ
jgi:hypothetical protein